MMMMMMIKMMMEMMMIMMMMKMMMMMIMPHTSEAVFKCVEYLNDKSQNRQVYFSSQAASGFSLVSHVLRALSFKTIKCNDRKLFVSEARVACFSSEAA